MEAALKKLKRHDEFHHKDHYDDVDVKNRSLVLNEMTECPFFL